MQRRRPQGSRPAQERRPAATVISSYAQPLLEGCGTIKKGDLRVIGETDPMPFVVAFGYGPHFFW